MTAANRRSSCVPSITPSEINFAREQYNSLCSAVNPRSHRRESRSLRRDSFDCRRTSAVRYRVVDQRDLAGKEIHRRDDIRFLPGIAAAIAMVSSKLEFVNAPRQILFAESSSTEDEVSSADDDGGVVVVRTIDATL